jgi:hypothetical protein
VPQEKATVQASSDLPAQSVTLKKLPVDARGEEARIREFLYASPGSLGWQTRSDDKKLDFVRDGRLRILGPDGSGKTWEGKWSLTGTEITMERPDLKNTTTLRVGIQGADLKLGDRLYTRVLRH